MKKLLLALLLIPTLCFAKIGDKKESIIQEIGNPEKTFNSSPRTEMARFVYPDGETVVIVIFLNGVSVAETYFSRYGREIAEETIYETIRRYSDRWLPLKDDKPNCRCIAAVDKDIRICYGAIPRTKLRYALSVLTTKGKPAFEDMSASGLRL